jgi:hypothetical protein
MSPLILRYSALLLAMKLCQTSRSVCRNLLKE